MNKQHIRVAIFTVIVLIAYIAFAVQNAFGVFTQPRTPSVTVVAAQSEPYTGGLMDYYACTRGNVRSACATLYNNPFMAYEPGEGLLEQFYACIRGNVQSACDALYSEDSSQITDDSGGLLDYDACIHGNVQSACDALYNRLHLS